ncbi:MAG: amidase family protein [Minwuia sp.]|uniref:amidase family protein n=1 Tax=Minwuia sp. TaxID=2493630 RepID=UPI003A8B212D
MDMGISPIHPDVRAATEAAMQHFRDMGTEIVDSTVDFSCAEPVFQILRAAQFAAAYGPLLETDRDKLKPEVIWNIEKGLALTAADIGWAERTRADLFHRFQAQFDEIDAFVTPTVNTPPFDCDIRYLEELEGRKFDSYISWLIMTFAITITTCPAISVPCGLMAGGLPAGLQIVGPQRGEDSVLAIAEMYEQASGRAFTKPVDPRGPAA